MARIEIAASILALTLTGCHQTAATNGSSTAVGNTQTESINSTKQDADDTVADACMSPQTQDALKQLFGSTLNTNSKQNAALGMYEGNGGLLDYGRILIVKDVIPTLEFSSTTIDGSDATARKTMCSTNLKVAGDPADGVEPRLTYAIQATLDGDGHDVVTLMRPIEVSAAVAPLAQSARRAKAAGSPLNESQNVSTPVQDGQSTEATDGPQQDESNTNQM